MALKANCRAWHSNLDHNIVSDLRHVSRKGSQKGYSGLDSGSYVKSPVASLTFVCSSVRNRVKVIIFVFTLEVSDEGISPLPLVAIVL